MSFIVTENWLNEKLNNKEDDIVAVDVRSALNDSEIGRQKYEESHIPRAVFLDLKSDLSGEAQQHGGNHPLPNINEFAEKLGAAGIGNQTTVVCYDDANGMFASRMWWLLHYIGHEKVYVLDGGFKKWVEAGNQVTSDVPQPMPKEFQPTILENAIVNMEEVKEKMDESSAILLDSRAKERYLGSTEPLYSKSGHIPGAKNFFWQNVLSENGLWKDEPALKDNFSSLPKEAEIIVSCGSGISACPNIIGLKEAGYENVKLYPGSFSDWISYEDNEIATGEE